MSLSAIEIIDETVEFYENNPRSLNPSPRSMFDPTTCLYNGPNGEACAFARCVLPEHRKKLEEGKGCQNILNSYGDDILKEQYRGHHPGFWVNIQALHDFESHCENGKLSQIGKDKVQLMKTKFGAV